MWEDLESAWNWVSDAVGSAVDYVFGDASFTNQGGSSPTDQGSSGLKSFFSGDYSTIDWTIDSKPSQSIIGDPINLADSSKTMSGEVRKEYTPPPGAETKDSLSGFLKNNEAMVFLIGGLASFGGAALTANANKDIAKRQTDIESRKLALLEAEQKRKFANSGVPVLSLDNTNNANIFNPSSPTYNPPRVGLVNARMGG